MLEAPRDLLYALNMHVVGSAPAEKSSAMLELKNNKGDLEGVVAAVPFLRDRDLRYGVAGETGAERITRIQEGIRRYYREMGELAESYRDANVPILATGHLYAKGAQASGKQDNIYIGDVENIEASEFPAVFDYVALGHLHRPQTVGSRDTVRYSGSLIPLSFSETKDDKGAYLIEFDKGNLREITFLQAPTFRRLKTIEGNLDKVKQSLRRFNEHKKRHLEPWVEVVVETDEIIPQLDVLLQEFTADMDLELVKIRLLRSRYASLDQQAEPEVDLYDMNTLEVFRKKCAAYGSPPEEMEQLENTFLELQDWMNDIAEEQ
jgi:exonuclease SbcD